MGNALADVLRAELREFAGGGARDARLADNLRSTLFAQQRALVDDIAHPKRAACCSRRAGKTTGIVRAMLARCLEVPRSVCVYFAMTAKSARRIVWSVPGGIPDQVMDFDLRQALVADPNETDMRLDFRNGSVLWVSGIDTPQDAKEWKGLPYDIGVLDEAQDWREEILEYMVNTALSPALMDHRGQLLVTGTPGPYLGGLFYEITTGEREGWGRHGWTCFENPHIPDARGYVAEDIRNRGLSADDPVVQREYFGRWVRDVSTLLYQYLPGRNDYATLPPETEWRHVLGMDFGVRDLATFVLNSYRPYDPTVYTQEVHGEQGADVTRCADIVRGFQQQFGSSIRLVADCGALGLGYALELRNRHGLAIVAAEKKDKPGALRLMNDQLRLGRIKLGPATGALKTQLQKVQIDPRTQIEKPSSACDYADAELYGWRDCYAYLAQPKPDDSAAGQQRAMVQRILAQRSSYGNPSLERERKEMALGPFD